jgi:type II secretory pathway pseudopilin PulG
MHRRGVMLVLVIVAIAMVAGLLSMIAASTAHRFRARRAEQIRLVARTIADSAAAYVDAHRAEWVSAPPPDTVELDVADLLPAKMTGWATLDFHILDGRTTCHVTAQAGQGIHTSTVQFDLAIE